MLSDGMGESYSRAIAFGSNFFLCPHPSPLPDYRERGQEERGFYWEFGDGAIW